MREHTPRVRRDAATRQTTGTQKVATHWTHDAGWALAHTAPLQKHLRPLLGDVDKSIVSRMVSGEKPSAVSHFYDLVRAVVRDNRADAGHLIAGAMVVAEEEACKLPSDEVRRRLMESLAQETVTQSGEDVAQHALAVALGENGPSLRGALEAYDDAVRHETAAHVDTLIYARALRVIRGWREAP